MQAKRGLTGIMNYTNPGAISHNEILELYRSYVDPEFSWKNFSVEEQAQVIKAPRSNNLLDTARVRAHSLPTTALKCRPQMECMDTPQIAPPSSHDSAEQVLLCSREQSL
jgi:hypothetical protein